MTNFLHSLESKKSKIKTFNSIIKNETVEQLLHLAKGAKKTSATIGIIEDNNYVAKVGKNFCNTQRVDYTEFQTIVDGVVEICKHLCEDTYKVQCKINQIDFLYYKNKSYYWPHVDAQVIDNNVAKRMANRDISCILYLNDDYEDGELYFKLLNKTFKPQAGNIITFPCSWEFLHGVNPVKGERYSIVMWFESNPMLFDEEIIDDPICLHYLNLYNTKE